MRNRNKCLRYAKKFFLEAERKRFYRALKTLESHNEISKDTYSIILHLFEVFPDFQTIYTALFVPDTSSIFAKKLLNKKGQHLLHLYREIKEIELNTPNRKALMLKLLFSSFVNDVRVLYFFLAERLVFAKHTQYLSPKLRMVFGKEMLEMVAPLAQVLGIHTFKEKAENIGFKILFSEAFYDIEKTTIRIRQQQKRSPDEKGNESIEVFIKTGRNKSPLYVANKRGI